MRFLKRAWLAFYISFLEAQIEERRRAIGAEALLLDEARRKVNLAHQAFAALRDRRHEPNIYQLRGR